MSLPRSYLTKKLPKAIKTKDGKVLRTIGDASNYALSLPADSAGKTCWQNLCAVLLAQKNAKLVAEQARSALFLDYRLDLTD
jgi:hypothetical protein